MKTTTVQIIHYGIEVKKFCFSKEKRDYWRKKLHLEDCLVIGCIGRLCYQKNHEFLLEIFKEINKKERNAKLLIIGRGELENEIRNMIQNQQLEDKTLLMGVRDDVNELLNAMDLFLLPSRYEGLGIVFVEAQANGLRCYTSAGVVPREANVCGNVTFIPLSKPAKIWAETILSAPRGRDLNACTRVYENGYDLETASSNLKEIYLKTV